MRSMDTKEHRLKAAGEEAARFASIPSQTAAGCRRWDASRAPAAIWEIQAVPARIASIIHATALAIKLPAKRKQGVRGVREGAEERQVLPVQQ